MPLKYKCWVCNCAITCTNIPHINMHTEFLHSRTRLSQIIHYYMHQGGQPAALHFMCRIFECATLPASGSVPSAHGLAGDASNSWEGIGTDVVCLQQQPDLLHLILSHYVSNWWSLQIQPQTSLAWKSLHTKCWWGLWCSTCLAWWDKAQPVWSQLEGGSNASHPFSTVWGVPAKPHTAGTLLHPGHWQGDQLCCLCHLESVCVPQVACVLWVGYSKEMHWQISPVGEPVWVFKHCLCNL